MATEGTIQFALWRDSYDHEKPFMLFMDIPSASSDQRSSNVDFSSARVDVHDIRDTKNSFTLDDHGFKVAHLEDAAKFEDHSVFHSEYLPAIEQLLRQEVEEADRILFFDWRRRNAAAQDRNNTNNLDDRNQFLHPATTAHVDQAPIAAIQRIKEQLGTDADQYLRGRVRIINVWRPVLHPVQDWPLAICDGTTVSKSDFLDVDQVRKDYVGSSMFMMKNDSMRWHYLSNQRPDEVLLFKQFDSLDNAKARFCPHSSFQLHGVPADAPPRVSVEVRALVLTKPL
ncbi:hypothetical protein BU24DRAFT_471539 [Aaosphaeria arxii CBS 175.79]|uniref:Methyltransferase n=1 Tax=Aaosphaeria arxii CBS 175.79 TaxID=1450172 RepID=A0A6A5YAV6_9PLEO|nr:uncharacterized protein BU24DRAFT_471539 [Aaosphaeria arxii CBS 175.79]KAF2022376.1 hypothetical protein BU24DRAFT_471539 [Aaosphaeria arxii CBS 175.79]